MKTKQFHTHTYTDTFTHKKTHTHRLLKVLKHSNTYTTKTYEKKGRNPKSYTENTQKKNYYLNTIKGNKFMFFALLIQNK